jgi:hypothetical protein
MEFFARLFNRSSGEHPRMPKVANVYYCETGILVATAYWDNTGCGGGGEPMTLMSGDTVAETIGEYVLRSIHESRGGLSKEALAAATAGLFRLAGVPNWDALENGWELIVISSDPVKNAITICPMRRCEDGGYVVFNGDPIGHCSPEPVAVGHAVRQRVIRLRPMIRRTDQTTDQRKQPASPSEATRASRPGFSIGDRVATITGDPGTVTHVDPWAEHGLGVVRVQFDDGRELTFALIASGLEPVS